MSTEPTTSLSSGSPTARRYAREQTSLFRHLTDLFWRVQTRMGVNEAMRLKYRPLFTGPVVTNAKERLDDARADEIEQRSGTLSPQTWARKSGRYYAIERAMAMAHRNTRMPGEVMPGDAGNTNVSPDQEATGQGGDGKTTK